MRDKMQDVSLRSRLNSASILKVLRQRARGASYEDRDVRAILVAEMAEAIVEDFEGADRVLANGIAMGVELATPPFGVYEAEHYKEHIENADYISIGVDLLNQMFEGLEDERIEVIIESVKAVLEGKDNLSEEAKAAKIACRIFEGACNLSNEADYRTAKSIALERVWRETSKKGTVTEPDYVQLMLDLKNTRDSKK